MRIKFGTDGTCDASTCKSGSETVMIKPSKNESVITTPSFFVFVMAVPMRSPMGVMAVSAPVVKNIMPTKMSTAPIKKHSRTLGESGAMVNESASTMVMMGRTSLKRFLPFFREDLS